LNGWVYTRQGIRDTTPAEVNFTWYGLDSASNRSSTGYRKLNSFAVWHNENNGYYTTGPILTGESLMYVDVAPGLSTWNNAHRLMCTVSIQSDHEYIEVHLDKPYFGLADDRPCTVLRAPFDGLEAP
jgi:hypothetical protein